MVSDKMDKTVVVAVERKTAHPKYNKIITKTKRYKAHDEFNQCRNGDRVRIRETRPLSKEKNWMVTKILSREDKSMPVDTPTYQWSTCATFPDEVIVGHRTSLIVSISLSSTQAVEASSLHRMQSLKEKIRVEIFPIVSPMDFDLCEEGFEISRTVNVPLELGSASTEFWLTARREFLESSIGVEFFQGTRYLGELEIVTKAIAKKR